MQESSPGTSYPHQPSLRAPETRTLSLLCVSVRNETRRTPPPGLRHINLILVRCLLSVSPASCRGTQSTSCTANAVCIYVPVQPGAYLGHITLPSEVR